MATAACGRHHRRDWSQFHLPPCTRSSSVIAPGANLLNFRVLDSDGNGSDSSVIAAIEQAIALKK